MRVALITIGIIVLTSTLLYFFQRYIEDIEQANLKVTEQTVKFSNFGEIKITRLLPECVKVLVSENGGRIQMRLQNSCVSTFTITRFGNHILSKPSNEVGATINLQSHFLPGFSLYVRPDETSKSDFDFDTFSIPPGYYWDEFLSSHNVKIESINDRFVQISVMDTRLLR